MIFRRPRTAEWYALGIALLAALCYFPTIFYGFVSDDHHLVLNHPYTHRVADWPHIFTSGHYDGKGGYRPLTTLSLAVNYLIGGANPAGYHLVNIALHALNSALVLLLLNRLLRSHGAAFIGAAIFAVHPIHSEAVAWISGRAELLATAFFLLAWLYHLRGWYLTALITPPRIFSGLAFFAALLCKENALIFPIAIVLGDLLVSRRQSHWNALTNLSWRQRCARLYLPSLVVIAFYFVVRWILYSRPLLRLPEKIRFVDNPLVRAPAFTRVLTAVKVQGEYLWSLIWPNKLCGDYSFDAVPLVTTLADPAVLLSLLAGCALLAFAGYSFYLRGRAWLGILFYLLAILPAANLLTLIGTMKAERLLYLPSLGFCLCAGLLVQRTYARLHASQRLARGAIEGVIVLLLCAGIGKTWQQNRIWRSENTLWQSTVVAAPENIKAQLNYGHEALTSGRTNEAIEAFRQARRIDPQSQDAVMNLGTALMQSGGNDEAVVLFEEAVGRYPNHAALHLNLGLAYLARSRPTSGVLELRRACEIEPSNPGMRFNLALALSTTGDPQSATGEYRRALELDPNYAEAWNGLGAALLKLHRNEEARDAFRRALLLRPGYRDAIYNMTLVDAPR